MGPQIEHAVDPTCVAIQEVKNLTCLHTGLLRTVISIFIIDAVLSLKKLDIEWKRLLQRKIDGTCLVSHSKRRKSISKLKHLSTQGCTKLWRLSYRDIPFYISWSH